MSPRKPQVSASPAPAEVAPTVVAVPSSSAGREFGGSASEGWNLDLLRRAIGTAWGKGGEDRQAAEDNVAVTAMALRAFAPADPVEAMIASQAVALHFASMECARRAMLPNQPVEGASKLRKDAANTARAMVDMVEALARHRGKGPQVVRVERVIVNEGGQAVVGMVEARARQAAPALGQGAAPMPLVEAAAVPAPQGEGPE